VSSAIEADTGDDFKRVEELLPEVDLLDPENLDSNCPRQLFVAAAIRQLLRTQTDYLPRPN
jgi:hypothetical protein